MQVQPQAHCRVQIAAHALNNLFDQRRRGVSDGVGQSDLVGARLGIGYSQSADRTLTDASLH